MYIQTVILKSALHKNTKPL